MLAGLLQGQSLAVSPLPDKDVRGRAAPTSETAGTGQIVHEAEEGRRLRRIFSVIERQDAKAEETVQHWIASRLESISRGGR